jgi:microcystin-dependent protein
MQLLKLMLLAALALWRGDAAPLQREEVDDIVKGVANRLRHEYKTMLDAQGGLFDARVAEFDARVAELKSELSTQKAELKAELATVRLSSVELEEGLGKIKARVRALSAESEGGTKKGDLEDVTALVTKLLDQHKRNSRSLAARVDALEETVQDSVTSEVRPGGNALLSLRNRDRRLGASESVDLQDAALWMQAKNAKILFGESGDTTLRRSTAQQLTTDHDFVVQRDLSVKGENWHLTTMINARENITTGDVISLCEGKACVGYGLEPVGRKGTNEPATDVRVICLGGPDTISVMFYRQWSSTLESFPYMRMVKTVDILTNDYTADPKIGEAKKIGTKAVSELRMATISPSQFIMVYRKDAASASALKVQGGIRLGEIDSVEGSTVKYAEEVPINLEDGFGFKRGIPIRLGPEKYCVVYEITDVDAAGKWLGSAGLAIGTIGGGSSPHRGVDLGSAEIISSYVSDMSAAAFNNDNHVAVAYRKQDSLGSLDVGMITLVDTSTTKPEVKTSIQFSPIQARFMDLIMISEKSVSIVYREPTRNFAGKGLLVNLVQSDTQLLATTPVPIAEESSIDNSYLLSATRISEGQLVVAFRNANGRPRLVDADVVGTTIVVGTPRKFAPEDHTAQTFSIAGLANSAFLLVYQDNEANVPHVATAVIAKTHGGALRTGVATSSGDAGEDVQVAIEGLVKVPTGTVQVNGVGVPMTPGARYYASYDGGISSSSDDGVLLGRALRDELLLLERDFAGGFEMGGAGAGSSSSAYAGEIKALAGATVPAGWLVCDGRAINRIDFSALFAAIGTTWGAGDSTTTFNIPDLRGRTAIGAGKGAVGGGVPNAVVGQAAASQHKLGKYDGSELFNFAKPTATLTKATLGSQSCATAKTRWGSGGGSSWNGNFVTSCSKPSFSGGSLAFNGGKITTKSGANFNMQPFATVQYIIKT